MLAYLVAQTLTSLVGMMFKNLIPTESQLSFRQ